MLLTAAKSRESDRPKGATRASTRLGQEAERVRRKQWARAFIVVSWEEQGRQGAQAQDWHV